MPSTITARQEILCLLADLSAQAPELPFGRLLHEVLQPVKRIRDLYDLDDEFLALALDLSVLKQKRPDAPRRPKR